MAEVSEKNMTADKVHSPANSHDEPHAAAPRPEGWLYRERRIFGLRIPCYASPQIQLLMVAFVCFLCPGMFNAVNGLGAGGQLSPYAASASNTAVYATFSVLGFFAGTFTNWLGIKLAFTIGGVGYCVYISAYLCYSHTQNIGFMIFAGVLLGLCASLLWSAQGAIMLAYPPENHKGRYVAAFWMIFNMGAVIGALVPLGQNINAEGNTTVSDGTYIGFIVLAFVGAVLACLILNAKSIIRDDGSRVIMMKNPTAKTEILGLWETLSHEPWIVSLFPMFFASNWFYTYQFNAVNGAYFNTRTRALNNVLYWLAQIVGAVIFGSFLDIKFLRRTTRARAGWAALFVLTMVIWGGGYEFQKGYTREETAPTNTTSGFVRMDWRTSGYVGPMFLYIFYGLYDAAWQTSIYWFIGALSNNSRIIANYVGFYKGIQSAGAAIIWRIDGLEVGAPPFMNIFASCWALLGGSLLIALPIILLKIKDTVPLEQDLKLSDETLEEVTGQTPLDDTARTSSKV